MLSESVSDAVAGMIRNRRQAIDESLFVEMNDLQIEIRHYERLLSGPSTAERSDYHYWHLLSDFDRELVLTRESGNVLTYGYSDRWPAAKIELENDLQRMRADLPTTKEMCDVEVKKLDELKQQYWR